MNAPMPADHPETRVVDQCPHPGTVEQAIKATEYKYFGDYEMDAVQRGAVETLVAFARHRLRSTDQQGMVRGARRASAIDANDVLQRQRRHKGAFHRDDIIAAMQIYAEQYARAALTGSEAR